MSTDFKFEKACDHKIIREQLYIEEDLRTIKIPRPLAINDAELWINDFKIEKTNKKFGWTIEYDDTSSIIKKSKIIFKNKIKSNSNTYFVSYTTQPTMCSKCRGLRLYNDISFTNLGNPRMIENEEKLVQEIVKGVYTELGSNPFHTWIGTKLKSLIGSKIANTDLIRSRMSQEISTYIEKYIEIQLQQSKYQDVTDAEMMFQLLSVEVQPDVNNDISLWYITITFSNRSGSELVVDREIKIPGGNRLLY